jgi:hypothetical protein
MYRFLISEFRFKKVTSWVLQWIHDFHVIARRPRRQSDNETVFYDVARGGVPIASGKECPYNEKRPMSGQVLQTCPIPYLSLRAERNNLASICGDCHVVFGYSQRQINFPVRESTDYGQVSVY